ncbi:hypothetical protein LTR67_000549 [Exophiala xenobiotica]
MSHYSVLYWNEDRTVAVIDIPSSIEHAQSTSGLLKSSPALESPYRNTEPKGAKRLAALNAISLDERLYHASIQDQISSALKEIRENVRSQAIDWCRDRSAILAPQERELSGPATLSAGAFPFRTDQGVPVVLSSTEKRTKFPCPRSLHGLVVHNPSEELAIVETINGGDYMVPPRSTFIYSTLQLGLPTFSICRKSLPCLAKRFDLILMDPPWSNRSVRHAGTYRTAENQITDPFEQALEITKASLAPRGLIAIWITNKASIRANVVPALQALGYCPFEEWIWIKVTKNGLPVTPVDGIWRRPYEILLLFREGQPCEMPRRRRRVIAAVPDLHSRKPCLKVLLEELVPAKYTALELFARNLTAGWWAWGDEVLKFQHESQWVSMRHKKGCGYMISR